MAALAAEEPNPDIASLTSGLKALDVGDENPRVIQELTTEVEEELRAAFAGVKKLALDAEGVDLGRMGEISIVQLATPRVCFLFDVLHKGSDDPLVAWLRGPLEDPMVIKIIHDCRMDSDALFHLLSITLANVHDTSCWATATLRIDRLLNLNKTLVEFGLVANTSRDGSVYADNHRFWASRPLTTQMIEWASGDVGSMFELQERQLGLVMSSSTKLEIEACAEAMTHDYLTDARSANIATIQVTNPGRFIGKGGANLRALQARTKAMVYGRGRRGSNLFVVYYQSPSALESVRVAASGHRRHF